MAENEILDFTSRQWKRTRAALARADLSPAAVAECVAGYFQSVLQRKLADPFREGQTHCGQCPGCIERRQAFAAAGIAELPGQYSFDLFTGAKLAPRSADYLHCYLDDAAAWLSDEAAIRRRLDWHLSTTRIPSEQRAVIAEHQYRHAQEVIATLGRLSADRLDKVSYPIQ